MTAKIVQPDKLCRNARLISVGDKSPCAPVETVAETVTDDAAGLNMRLKAGVIVSLALLFTIFGWAAFAELSGAVIASGVVVVDNSSKKVQHPLGGVVGEIRVKNGDHVKVGDLLVRLDDTQTRASLGIIQSQLVELIGRKARLAAERDNADTIAFPLDLAAMGPEAAHVMEGEQRLFQARQTSANGQKAQLAERIKQNEEEIKGLNVQRTAKGREQMLIRSEVTRVSGLQKQNLLPVTRVLSLEREETRIDGENGALTAQVAKLGGLIAEAQLQILAIDQNKFSDAQKELRDVEARVAELRERKIAAEDQLQRVNLRAPIDGTVHELTVHTLGGVVGPAEQLMLVVPQDEILMVEIRIPALEIDQIKVGQPAMLRFPAFNRRTTPEVKGVVARVSPDISRDPQTGQPYYTARVTPSADITAQLDGQKLIPGMPVEAFIETAPRTALSYLAKPVTDQFQRAFRER
jgi:HlyD family secretion protein